MIALSCRLKSDAADALDLRFTVLHNVRRDRLAVCIIGLMLAKIDAADELAHDDEIDALFDNRFFQRRSVRELRPDLRRAVVAVNTHTRAQAQQTLFRALRARHIVPLVAAYGAEQHTVGSYALIEHFLRQRVAPLIDGTAAHIDVCIMKGVSVQLCNFIQYAERFVYDLRADAVAADHRDVLRHLFSASLRDFSKPPALMMF